MTSVIATDWLEQLTQHRVVEHVYHYKGTTTFDSGHVHHFAGETGPAIPLPDGRHYHLIEGETTVDSGPEGPPHRHAYQGKAK